MPFIGPLKGACPGLCPQKARRHSFLENQIKDKTTFFLTSKIHPVYVKINVYARPKITNYYTPW